ncbi:MAG: cell division protein ZapB [Treponema sp.]|jgi:hypothetical protein|nr:cell division protein ZapB [Treponema sp.]
MINLEQVKLLETKVIRAIEYVERTSRENAQLQGKLDIYQRRIDELEVLIRKFREDQGRIEEGILSALDRLNKFEDAIEKSFAPPPVEAAAKPEAPERGAEQRPPVTIQSSAAVEQKPVALEPKPAVLDPQAVAVEQKAVEEPEKPEPEEHGEPVGPAQDGPASGELDIF